MVNRSALIVPWIGGILAMWVGCGPGVADFARDLGDGYSFVSTGPLQKYILRGGDYAVRNLVVDLDYDDEFIVGLRLVVEEYECEPGSTLTELITPEVEYWVIEKRRKRVHGPLSRSDLARIGRQLGFSDDLQLDEGRIRPYLDLAEQLDRAVRIQERGCRPFASG